MDDKYDIDQLLSDARGEGAEMAVPDALFARIMSDAADQMPRRRALEASGTRRSLGAALLAALGGWAAVSGLAAATVAGVWLGFSPPAALDSYIGGDTLSVSIDPQFYGIGTEG